MTDKDPSWYIDSGASTHMCSDNNFFTYFDRGYTKGLVLANGQKLSTAGIGEGFIQCITGNNEKRRTKLAGVINVRQQHGNLTSVKKLTSKGCEVHFKDNECIITRNEETIVRASRNFDLCFRPVAASMYNYRSLRDRRVYTRVAQQTRTQGSKSHAAAG